MTITVTSLSLLEAIRRSGDERAWREFFSRYGPMLVNFARKMGLSESDAADAVQETLIAVHGAFAGMQEPFDRSKGPFKVWLRGIAAHKVQDLRRRAARATKRDCRAAQEISRDPCCEADAVEAFEREWQKSQLAAAMRHVAGECDPAVFQAFELYAVHEQPADQVAELLGISRNAVYINKSRVLTRLRVALASLQDQEG